MRVLLLLSLVAFSACQQKRVKEVPVQSVETPLAYEPYITAKLSLSLLDYENSEAVVSTGKLDKSPFQETYLVPTFTIKPYSASFVKILRCQHELREVLEPLVKDLRKSTQRREDRGWVWKDAYGDTRGCHLVADHFLGEDFQDVAAPTGQYFYLVNPCVDRSHAKTNREECSYRLAMTESIKVESSMSEEIEKKVEELTTAESEYDALAAYVDGELQRIVMTKESCIRSLESVAQGYKDRVKAMEMKRALGMIGASVAGLGVGTVAVGAAMALSKRSARMQLAKYPVKTGAFTAGFAGVGIFAAAANATKGDPEQPDLTKSCPEAMQIADELVKFESEGRFRAAMEKLVRISNELADLDATFKAYDQDLLKQLFR